MDFQINDVPWPTTMVPYLTEPEWVVMLVLQYESLPWRLVPKLAGLAPCELFSEHVVVALGPSLYL